MPGSEELYLLQRKLETHISEFDKYVESQNARWNQVLSCHEESTKSIEKLILCMDRLQESTKDIVEAWNTGTSVIRFGGMVGKFLKWVMGFTIIGAIVTWCSQHIKV